MLPRIQQVRRLQWVPKHWNDEGVWSKYVPQPRFYLNVALSGCDSDCSLVGFGVSGLLILNLNIALHFKLSKEALHDAQDEAQDEAQEPLQ